MSGSGLAVWVKRFGGAVLESIQVVQVWGFGVEYRLQHGIAVEVASLHLQLLIGDWEVDCELALLWMFLRIRVQTLRELIPRQRSSGWFRASH